ncbi:MAG: CHAP domain-containing protein [Stellaceae bacterium]
MPYYGGNCVSYARAVTGMHIPGDAGAWWNNAAGRYSRGHAPAPGAVLVFKPHGAMWHGHVAVVSHLVNRREILVNQANWVPGRVVKDMAVYDVSAANNWSAVRVADFRSESWGRINPTFGFVYPHRPEPGANDMVVAAIYHPVSPADRTPALRLASDETIDDTAPARDRRPRHDRLGLRATSRRETVADRERHHPHPRIAETTRHERAIAEHLRQVERHNVELAARRHGSKAHDRHSEQFAVAEQLRHREELEAKKARVKKTRLAARHEMPSEHTRRRASIRVAETTARDKLLAERVRRAEHHTVVAEHHVIKPEHHRITVHRAAKTDHLRHAETRTARVEHPVSRHPRHVATRERRESVPEQIAEVRDRAN